MSKLNEIARAMVAPGKGVLAGEKPLTLSDDPDWDQNA